jgi:aspartyl-tRNA(Asn)/glutamyl-tRNA(Gln) amidotransferase subunit A
MPATTTARSSEPACGSIHHTREILRQGNSTVAGHVASVLTAIAAADARLGSFVAVAGEQAMRDARAADEAIGRLGAAAWLDRPLLGVTVSVKDLIQTQDLPTRRGSLLANSRAMADAPAVARLRAAGAIVVGKTSTSEYGWSASTVSRVAAPTRNPWASERSAGGSSGGAAAAVAAGFCSAALGTDGAGSIRIPAAFCGVVGYKPSFGRIPYVPACADRLAHLGPLAGTVADVIELDSILRGPDLRDPDSATGSLDPRREPASLRIGWIEFPGTAPRVRDATERALPVLEGQGHRVEPVPVPFPDPYQALVDLLAADAAAATSPADEELCDHGRLAVVRHGRKVSGAAVIRAEEARLSLRVTLRSVMERFDLLAMATVPVEPFEAGAIAPHWAADPADLMWLAWTPATYPFNLTGQPALSLPVGLTASGLPAGLQLVGPVGGDELVLSAARRIEAGLGPRPVPQIESPKG